MRIAQPPLLGYERITRHGDSCNGRLVRPEATESGELELRGASGCGGLPDPRRPF